MMKSQITQALSAIIGLPLSGAHRAMNMEMFEFGERGSRLTSKGKLVEYGEYGLHVQCPWRIVSPKGILVGSEDRNCPEDESSDWGDFDCEGPTRLESKLQPWLDAHSAAPLKVEQVESDDFGGFTISLEQGFSIQCFPANSLQGEQSEYWRLFRPQESGPHFVATGHGVEI